ncbi:hypothetical protein BHM03_00022751 [Ensete ventricosum]|nr:hypothetical protein BHM03_00022751 [Ensete ventricosum]
MLLTAWVGPSSRPPCNADPYDSRRCGVEHEIILALALPTIVSASATSPIALCSIASHCLCRYHGLDDAPPLKGLLLERVEDIRSISRDG